MIGRIIIISKSFQDNTLTNQGDYIVSSIPNVSLNSEATFVEVIIKKTKHNKDVTKYNDITSDINADTKEVIVANSQTNSSIQCSAINLNKCFIGDNPLKKIM